jgi:hypothetical protein
MKKVLVAAIAALVVTAAAADAKPRKAVIKVRGYNVVMYEIGPGHWRSSSTGRVIDCTYRGKNWSCVALN